MRTYNELTLFVTPTLTPVVDGKNPVYKTLVNSYLTKMHDGTVDYSKLVLTFDGEPDTSLVNRTPISVSATSTGYEYTYDISDMSSDVKMIAQGRYSEVSSTYKTNFPEFFFTQKLVLQKNPIVWEEYWEPRIGLPYPEGAELWGKPEITNITK